MTETPSLRRILLTPVEVFGADREPCEHCGEETGGGYGLSDATGAQSDCNRAFGHIYRVDDIDSNASDRVQIEVWIEERDLYKLSRNWSDRPSPAPPVVA